MTGHFTQVVWAATTHVGAARSADGTYVAANYFPAGNIIGEHPENVFIPKAKPKHHDVGVFETNEVHDHARI